MVRGGREEIKKSLSKKKKPEVLFEVCEKCSFIEFNLDLHAVVHSVFFKLAE